MLGLCGLLFTALSCSSKKPSEAQARAAASEAHHRGAVAVLQVTFPSARVSMHHYVVAEVSLTNVSSKNLWVNGRMLLNREDDRPEVREVWILVQGPKGFVQLECYKRTRDVDDTDYRLLKPNETIRQTELLNDCYTIETPGVYKLMAFYKDGNPRPPAAPAGAVHLSQELQSEEASFEVVQGS